MQDWLVGWKKRRKDGQEVGVKRGERARVAQQSPMGQGWVDGAMEETDRKGREGKGRERKGREGQEGGKREVCLCVCVMSVCLCYAKHPVPAVCFFSLLFPACGQKGSRGTRKDKGKAHKKKSTKHKAHAESERAKDDGSCHVYL